tara:strand:+ start:521 stop:760 length:240 start_codon:yes stop_codon:yes gene_type:complete
MKHTKGKWGIGKGEFGLDINNGEGTIGTIYGDDTEAKANANLIASAPDMLEMLKKLNKLCPNTCEKINVGELINKAGGK